VLLREGIAVSKAIKDISMHRVLDDCWLWNQSVFVKNVFKPGLL
jgi:hypothetical protein